MIQTMILAMAVGFAHAFEADHLVAVSSIVTKRKTTALAIKDGIFWGLGHTSILLLAGLLYLFGHIIFNEQIFNKFEAAVGVMLIILGAIRLYKMAIQAPQSHHHLPDGSHKMAYGIGALHGLAGSGAVLLTVLSKHQNSGSSLLYILIFGLGSILGMMVAAGIFSIPFSIQILKYKWLARVLTAISSILCIILGFIIFYKNLF